MKPDLFMPFYGNEFFQAVDGQPSHVIAAYLRAIWHYWSHTHCDGLPDKQDYLRRVCRPESDDEWQLIQEVVFDDVSRDFFILDNGKWHQSKARAVWEDTTKKYENIRKRSQIANKIRWKK